MTKNFKIFEHTINDYDSYGWIFLRCVYVIFKRSDKAMHEDNKI